MYRGRSRSLHGKGQFTRGKGHPIVKYRNTLPVQMAVPIEMPFSCGLRWAQGIMCEMGSRSRIGRGNFKG